MIEKSAKTWCIVIYIGGDIAVARQVCREYCMKMGFCVTVEAVSYIYTGGAEEGVRIGIINYPRFPASIGDLEDRAQELAEMLRERLCQHSYSIVTPAETRWFSVKKADGGANA